jgi:hypothetical protein
LLPLDSGRVWHWIVIVTVFLSTVWLSRYSPAICLLTIGLLFSSLLVAPEFAVDWIQAITTSAILGGMFILTHRLVDEKRAAHTKGSGKQVPNNTKGQSKSIPATKVTTLSALLIAFSFAQGTGLAQNEADSLQEKATDQKPFYSVVFPVDDSGNMTGDISYVGEDFLKWLNRRKGLSTARNHVLSAKHEVVIDNSLEGNFATPSCLVTSVYEWNVQDQEEVIRIVLPGDKSTIINISMNGVEQSIPSDVASTNAIVELRPRALSLTEVRIKFRIPVSLDLQNLSSVRFPVLPNPNATADILGLDTADLQTNAIGQVTNPSTGRHMIALGKQSELLIRWRQGLPRIVSVSEPVSVEMEWSVACNESVIRCMINCPGQAIEPNYLDVECDQNWEPLGFDWEDGKVVDVFAGSTNLKKRFRIQWKDASDPSRRQLRFFLHKKHDSNTSLISLPTVGISNAIIETRSVVIAQGGPCRWEVNRSRGWVDANPESSFQWLTRESEITQSFKTQDSSATLSIQPITTTNLPSVAMVSNLLFGSHSITGHTQFQLDPLAKSTNEVVLVASPLMHLLSIHSEGKELHHLESTLEDGTHRIQVFVDRSNVKSGNFQIEFQQNYGAIDKWINLPTIMITNANVSSHQITAARLLDVPVEFDGIERPGFSRTTDGSYKKPSQDDKLPNQKIIVNLNPPVASALPFQLFQSGRTPNQSGVTTAAMNAIHEHLWLFDAKPSAALGAIEDSGQDSLTQLRYRIRSTQDELRGYCISVLTPEGDGWKYRLLGSVSSKDTIQAGLLFEMPVEIASSLTSENSLFQFDSPEPGKRLLLVYSKRSPTTEKTTELTEPFVFSIECQLDTEHAVNGIRVPEVRLLNGPSVEQWIAVPKSASGRKLTWTTSGVRNSKQAPEVTSVLNIPSSELSWFSSFSQQPEVRLNSLSSAPTIPKVPLAFHRFQPLDSDVAQLDSFFVVEPQGASFVSLKLPSRMELLSVFVNEETSPFRVETDINNDGKLSLDIPLQSSALPQCVKAVFKVPTSQNQIKGASQEVVLPILRGLNPAKTVIELDQSYVARDQLLQSKAWENLSHEGLDELILDVVTSCSKRFTETSSDLNLPQRNRWWAAWQAIATELLFPTADDLITKSVDRWIALRDLMHSQWRLDVLSQADGFIQPNGTELVEITPQKNLAFVLDTTIENNPRIQISQTTSTASTRSVKAVVFATFGLLIMIVAVVPVLRNLLYRVTDFVMECLQIRPWLLFAMCGAIICLSSSHSLAGFALLAVAFVLVLRQYVYQFRILASRSASKI